MGRFDASTVAKQFKRTFNEGQLNALGKETRFCRREREATPFRLMLALLEAFGSAKAESIADIQRTFNALSGRDVRYKPFHNQLAKPEFPRFMREVFERMLDQLACEVLSFSPESPFARFEHIRMQDGSSFGLHPGLKSLYPGRFTRTHPAAVELHVDLDLMSEMPNRVGLAPDCEPERPFLPDADEVAGGLLLADRGYCDKTYFEGVHNAGGHFIVRGKTNINPLIRHAFTPDGQELKQFRGECLKAVKHQLAKYDCLDLLVCLDTHCKPFECRLVMHANLRPGDPPRFLLTNLEREHFSTEQVSDGYRLRWQIELLFKQWKSYANLHAFATENPNIAEGLIWASLCAATLKRYCTHVTERIARVAMSTHRVAKCIRHVLPGLLRDLMHRPRRVPASVQRAINYLAANAQRAHPKRDAQTGRLKLGLRHVYADA